MSKTLLLRLYAPITQKTNIRTVMIEKGIFRRATHIGMSGRFRINRMTFPM